MNRAPILLLAVVAALPVPAGPPRPADSASDAAAPRPELIFQATGSYELEADFEDRATGSTEAIETKARATVRWLVGENWRLSIGGVYAQFDFPGASSPIPETLKQVSGELGLEYLVGGRPAVFLSSRPGFFYSGDFKSDAFDAPTVAAAGYPITRNLVVSVGALYSRFSETPVLPIAGLIWQIDERWQLDLRAPEVALSYRWKQGAELALKGEMTATTLRVGDDLPEPYRGEILDYLNLRAGLGLKLGTDEGWQVEADAGWTFYRRFEYDDLNRGEDLEGAPYLRLAFRWNF